MSKMPWRTKPDDTTGMPGGVPYIIGNEAAERFSFYGMRTILIIFMTKYLLDASGNDATMNDEDAKSVFHLFVAAAYFTPMLGAMVADIFLGKYMTILTISLLYCVGHGMLAMMDLGPHLGLWDMEPFLYSGLFLIALGAGGIKPCVSAHVGDQFGSGNKHLMTQVFNWFYFSINLGAAASQFMTPWLLDKYGPAYAFGLPGVLMAIATFVFWMGRHKFIHVPASGWKKFKEETFSPEGRRALLNLSPLFLVFVPMFWAIFDQTGSAWVLQADQMDRQLVITWLPSQIQFVNPVMILLGIPVFTYVVYPLLGKLFKVTPLRKIGIGLALTAGSFVVSGMVQETIEDKKEGISVELYADLSEDLGPFETTEDFELKANTIKAVIRAAENATLEPGQFEAVTGLTMPDLMRMVDPSQYRKLVSESKAEKIAEELKVVGDSPGLGATITLMTDSEWDREQYKEIAGLTASKIVGRLGLVPAKESAGHGEGSEAADESEDGVDDPDPNDLVVSQLMTGDQIRATFKALSEKVTVSADDEDEPEKMVTKYPSDLAAAVKAARAVWTQPREEPGAKIRSDEDRIVGNYLKDMPNIVWQFLAYLILTSAEIMVSIVCLEFAYSQSPRKMKSFIMGVYFLGVSFGNLFVSGVNFGIGQIKGATGTDPLEGANYYWFFAGLMLLVAILYIPFAMRYKGQTFIQGEDEEDIEEAEALAEGTEQ